MKLIIRYLFGGFRYTVYCNNPSVVCGILMRKYPGVVFAVKICDGYFEFSCFSYVRKRVLFDSIIEGMTVVEASSFGIVRQYRRIKSRPGLVLGVLIALAVIYLQTIPLWEIKVSGNSTVSDSEIISGLSEVGFAVGKPKNSELLPYYANQLIIKDHRLSRLSINLSGNIAFVEVGERTETELSDIPSSITGLYASRDGIVELPIAQSGESLVRKGDTVCRGQLLISPVILGDNNKEYIVGAEGTVLGRTEDVFITVIPYSNAVAIKTERNKTEKRFNFLGEELTQNIPFPKLERVYEKRALKRSLILNRFEFPVDVVDIEKREYTVSSSKLSVEKAKHKAYDKLYSRISEEKSGAEILSVDFFEREYDDYFLLECRVECIENIASPNFG